MDRKEDIEMVVTEAPEDVAKMLRGAAHPARVVILASLAADHGEFSYLVERTRLSKNALVNHLNQLIDLGLVRRALRGEYVLTADGAALILAAANTYRCSVRRREMTEEALRRSYVQPNGAMDMEKNILNKPARYQPCWASYNGAMAGLLASQGIDCDVAEVAGRSGYAFVTNVFEGRLCASGPTALGIETWVQMREGTESLGYKLEHWTDYSAEPREGAPSVKELEKMKRLFDRIRNEIDQGRPAVLWGIAVPEYGLVNGYEGDSYIVSSFRGAIGMPDGPVKYHELDAPGCYDAYFIKGRNERKEGAKEMLSRALRFATGEVRSEKGYVNGPQAFLAWADALESSAVDERSYMSNAYVGACAQEAKGLASTFLGRSTKSTRCPEMAAASQAYADLSAHLQKFTALFPFEQEGNLAPADRLTGAALLREAYELEMNAVSSLSRAREALD